MVDKNSDEQNSQSWRDIERVDLMQLDSPLRYKLFDPDLKTAVNTAVALGMPLLLTGEPGVGKSTLAAYVANSLGLASPLKYRVKSDTKGQELLYDVDYLARMADAQLDESHKEKAKSLAPYLRFNALGKAILRTWPAELLEQTELKSKVWSDSDAEREAKPSVVLIDEIDKAPSDVPNDLLEELRTLSFVVPGLLEGDPELSVGGLSNATIAKTTLQLMRPIVVVTSNASRSLPAAFLRRCVYYHMSFPAVNTKAYDEFKQHLNDNVKALVAGHRYDPALAEEAYKAFESLRGANLKQPPSTAELLSLLSHVQSQANQPMPKIALSLLVKRQDDLAVSKQALGISD